MDNDTSPQLGLFPGDSQILSAADALSLRRDLDKLVAFAWPEIWQVQFYPSKFYILRVHRTKTLLLITTPCLPVRLSRQWTIIHT